MGERELISSAGTWRSPVGEKGCTLEEPGPDKAMVFQEYALLRWLNARENVEIGLELKGLSKADRRATASEFLDLVGLSDAAERPSYKLSGGMQQRVSIARALALRPPFLRHVLIVFRHRDGDRCHFPIWNDLHGRRRRRRVHMMWPDLAASADRGGVQLPTSPRRELRAIRAAANQDGVPRPDWLMIALDRSRSSVTAFIPSLARSGTTCGRDDPIQKPPAC